MDAVKPNLVSNPHIDKYGTKRYYLPDGRTLHRADGPALEHPNGDKVWYLNGKIHRADGPALEKSNRKKEYFLNGVRYSFKEWNRLRKMLWIL